MAFSITATARPYSLGKVRAECQAFAVTTTLDIAATITALGLSRVDHVVISSGILTLTAAPTYSGNQVTLAFTVPAGGGAGNVLLVGV